ncbi:Dolichyl-diphosphooligosaccharide--protein glycosyltransferase 48 kDa subunit [Tripterygium wilfordii]|uniref:Dolichyl-diphosphooligosaccharide--protein glycosyltransferase 48 kDa subunit n=1 Tax=Tripterygium wilfordii TaxID=458696 RepID=A0A7J7DXY7_TRIWF|nr:Dolichyl-diphosphooligosaccharide--protein glycosyltransferase 48 kDa subunit [Tripterygium wilfordii]
MANSHHLLLLTLILLPVLCYSFSPESPTDRRVLVLLDDFAIKSSHSLYFNSLQSRGFELDFKLADDPKIALHRYGQYLYDALILFCPTIDRFGGSVDLAAILDFVDSGHDLIIAADANASDLIREVAIESGVAFDEDPAAIVIDHISYAVSENEGDHSLIASDDFIKSDARNNARILITSSLSIFSNRYINLDVICVNRHLKCGNEQFLTELSKWVFHERGHLKAVNVKHHKVGEVDEPAVYRINDDLEYSVEIYEWSGTSWQPFVADDVQVQFYMMSPYVLKTLSTNNKGIYHTGFKVPDVYGVFQFKVEYQRPGYTSLSLSKQIPVRPYRHNEYERFIPAAYPYYGAAFSMMAGFFIFTIVHLYNK